jgi:type II secretory ATPase GspE/PulE/Tfp pilus assembly ATPase PilB-like protein
MSTTRDAATQQQGSFFVEPETPTQVNDQDIENLGIGEEDVNNLIAAIQPIPEVWEAADLQRLSQRLPYKVALENQAVLLEMPQEGVYLVGMCAPANFTHVVNIARALNVHSRKLNARLLTEQRFHLLLETAYEQSIERNQPPPAAEEHFEDLADHAAKQETLSWSQFESSDETHQDARADNEIDIGEGTGMRASAGKIILDAIKHRASDIHVVPQLDGGYINFRTDGAVYQRLTGIPMARMDNLANAFADMAKVDGYKINQRGIGSEMNIAVTTASGRKERMTLRFQGKKSYYGRTIVIRINRAVFRDFQQIGIEPTQIEAIQNALHHRTGVILVTGPTGSGKSNSLEAMLRRLELMHKYRKHVIQIGNPIEFPNNRRTQLPVDDDESWAEALKDSMRMDPDIFSPGEFRDEQEAAIVFQAAATGHLTLTTLHTNNVAQTFSRLDFLKIDRDKCAGLVQLIASQQLIPVLCPHCKTPEPDTRAREITEQLIDVVFPDHRHLKEAVAKAEGRSPFFRAEGCPKCDYMGIKGRTCIAEVLPITPELGRMLRNNTDGQDVVDFAVANYGMMTLAEAATRKLIRGELAYDDIFHLLLSRSSSAPETESRAEWQTTEDRTDNVYQATTEPAQTTAEVIADEEYIDAEEFEVEDMANAA